LLSITETLAPLAEMFKCDNFSPSAQENIHSLYVQNSTISEKEINFPCDVWTFRNNHGCPLWTDSKNPNFSCPTEPSQKITLWIISWLQWLDQDINKKLDSFKNPKSEVLKNIAKDLFEDKTGLIYEIGQNCAFRPLILRNVDPVTNTCIPFSLHDINHNGMVGINWFSSTSI
jgi:hypothetical protein